MTETEFKQRTQAYALRMIRLTQALPSRPESSVIRHQLLKCATSVGANYRAACRGKSRKDITAKLAIVEEEADESLFWLDLIAESGLLPPEKLAGLQQEGNELLAMTVASIKTLRTPNPKSKI